MKCRLGIVLAVVISTVVGSLWFAKNGTETADGQPALTQQLARPDGDRADIALGDSTTQTVDLPTSDRVAEPPTIPNGEDATGSGIFNRVSPDEIESALYQRIAEQPGLRLTSLTAVECDTLRCKILFSGVDPNPQTVDEYHELLGALMKPPWKDYQPTSGSIGTREVSPGAREYVLELTYVALVDASDDPDVAARQHAACAGAWARVTQLRGSNEYIRMAHEQAAEHLDLAASWLGSEEARRLADELQFGPLTRECQATPY